MHKFSKQKIILLIKKLKIATKHFTPTLIETIIQKFGKNPFLILIATILSLRSKDKVTLKVAQNLFKEATTPSQISSLPLKKLEAILFNIGFYKTKAKTIKEVAKKLEDKYKNSVPTTYKELIKIKGIGPKTANLVLSAAFNKKTICVDTHVHRISNRIGLIKTKNVEQTELALKKIIPPQYWSSWNTLLVKWGQNICLPRHPKCYKCFLAKEKLCLYFLTKNKKHI